MKHLRRYESSLGFARRAQPKASRRRLLFVLRPRHIRYGPTPKSLRLFFLLSEIRQAGMPWFEEMRLWRDRWRCK